MKEIKISIGVFMVILCFCSCKKFLDEKPNQKIATPTSLSDLEGILEYYNFMNVRYPSLGEICADNYYLTNATWSSAPEVYRPLYYWQKSDNVLGEWGNPYSVIYYANVILETINKDITNDDDESRRNKIIGSALFIRAYYHLSLVHLFAKQYDPATAENDLGIPLKIDANYNENPPRSSLKKTYEQIIADLLMAVKLLPTTPESKNLPCKPGAYGALARTYLSMRDYERAGIYADSCLKLYDSLLNYNSLSQTATVPFPVFNKEVIYDCRANNALFAQNKARIDSNLYLAYENNDLRKAVFFKSNGDGSYGFKGNYTGVNTAAIFAGISTDEMYLTRAESFARAGETAKALADLDSVRYNRMKTGTFISSAAANASEALTNILNERRKELLFRCLRWMDLKRLNAEVDKQVSIFRFLNGQLYKLEPSSLRYVLQIDYNTVKFGIVTQNP